MAIKTDFLIRQIQEFLALLIGLILGVNKEKFAKRMEISFQAYKLLDLDPQQISSLTVEEVFTHFEKDPTGVDKAELLAYSIFNQYIASENREEHIDLARLANGILREVDQKSSLYSMERKMTLELLQEHIKQSEPTA